MFVTTEEFEKHIEGHWRTVHDLWRHVRTFIAAGAVPQTRQINAGAGLAGGGDLSADRTLSLSHLGLEALADPDTDRIYCWDDSAGVSAWLQLGGGVSIDATPALNIDHNLIDNYVANEHINWEATAGCVDNFLTSGTLSAAGITDTSTAATNMAAGTTGQRPGGIVGDIRYNSTLGEFELYIAAWHNLARGGANVNFGTVGCGTITIADGSSLLLQEDITFSGATTENIIAFPDNLPDAFSFKEGANFYQTFITTNGSEAIHFQKPVGINVAAPTFMLEVLNAGNDLVAKFRTERNVASVSPMEIYHNRGVGNVADNDRVRLFTCFSDSDTTASAISTAIGMHIFDVTHASRSAGLSFFTMYPGGTLIEKMRLDQYGNLGLGIAPTFGANAHLVFLQNTGVAPTTSPANCFQMYSADIGGAAGKAGAHFRDEEGNIVSIGSGGMLMTGTARVYKYILLSSSYLERGSTAPDPAYDGNYLSWSYDIGDDSTMTTEVPHDWAPGTDMVISVHWFINEAYAVDKEVKWQIDWSMCPYDETEDISAPTHSGTLTAVSQNIPAVAKHLTSTTVGTIVAANIAAGDDFGLKLTRIAADNDDPIADPQAIHLEVRYISNKMGAPT